MLNASLIGTALAIAAVLGASITAYLWLVRRQQIATAAGIKTLAAMRWREFSHFVIDALRDQGFEPDLEAPHPPKGEQADLLLLRGGETWLLGCKQGADQVIGAPQVEDLARSVRQTAAVGGILATLGKIDPTARSGNHGIQLLDGVTLWRLVEPLLPQSLQEHLAQRAHTATVRGIQWSWLAALLLGFALAMALSSMTRDAPPVAAVQAPSPADAGARRASSTAGAAIPEPAPPAAPTADEDDRRDQVMRAISILPGIEKAMWSTRSTLLVYLEDAEASKEDVDALCAILERFDELRASRVQLQAPADSGKPVRFIQCQAY